MVMPKRYAVAFLKRSRRILREFVPERLHVTSLPHRLHLRREGATEGLVDISVNLPACWASATDDEKALLRRYLPVKRPAASPEDCAIAKVSASVQWRMPNKRGDAMIRAYRARSIAQGRSQADTDLRIERIIDYADAVQAGACFPPIILYVDGRHLIMLDGARRALAHLLADCSNIDAIVAMPTMCLGETPHRLARPT
ncbi:hypothetical protein [Salinarimonas sp.]|uniref:hypothetical protein n=1 Tax=Salinarimonas sp. TaxID=2766526 RepID=UPI0032D8C37A